MYLLDLKFTNAALQHDAGFLPAQGEDYLLKWNVLEENGDSKTLELLRILALGSCGCSDFLDRLHFNLGSLLHDPSQELHIELAWKEHMARNKAIFAVNTKESALHIHPQGYGWRLPPSKRRLMPGKYAYSMLSKWSKPAKHPVFAYGPDLKVHQGTDDFDFTNPFYQLRRISSLFNPQAKLTDPLAFLSNLNYRGIRHRRYMPAQILRDLQSLLAQNLNLDTSQWMDKNADFSTLYMNIPHDLQPPILLVLDVARHLHDALPRYANPLRFPGIIILDRPNHYCPRHVFSQWIQLLDTLFPAAQFFISLPSSWLNCCPQDIFCKKLPDFPNFYERYPQNRQSRQPGPKLPPKTVLLLDVDSRLPNIALMKLSRYYKNQGYRVRLGKKEAYEPGAEKVFASCVFHLQSTRKHLQNLRAYYGQDLQCGGSGIDIHQRLAPEIENTAPDFDLYPELQDRAIGFLTRGCPFSCSFCIVPEKEGKPRQVNDLESLAAGRKKLILLDDNILAYPGCTQLLEEMARKKLWVNFNQTLDINLVDAHKAELLRSIQCCNVKFTRTVYHFSLNDCLNLEKVREKYELFNFSSKDNVEFICMYGYNTTLAEDLQRFRFLRSLPGAYVFVQEYQPILGGPQPQLDNYFDEQADAYIDELIRICFPQCMKSMEKYYRWLSKLYAQHFGKLHMGLVDTIFRYNARYKRGRYIASLAGTRAVI
ncbi:MAG: hypothetical protein ACQEQX_10380 [Thermodesulfobacteriota bacterium]